MNETVESAAAETGAWCQAASPGPFQLTLAAGSQGFEIGHWNDKAFLQGRSVGDTAVLEHVVIHDIIRIFYWRSRTIGLGTAHCSVNDGKPVPLNGYWDSKINGPE